MKKHPFLVGCVVGLVLAAAMCLFRMKFGTPCEVAIGDGFFIPGVLYLCAGLLNKINETGQFDMITYSAKGWRRILKVFGKKVEPRESFADYKKAKEEARKTKSKPVLIWLGVGFLVAAALAYVIGTLIAGGANAVPGATPVPSASVNP